MKTILRTTIAIMLVISTFSACKKDSAKPAPVATTVDQHPQGQNNVPVSGQVVFYYNGGIASPSITVNIGGMSGLVSGFYSNGVAQCGASGCATFVLAAGTYSWNASSNLSQWNGQVTVTQTGCAAQLLQ